MLSNCRGWIEFDYLPKLLFFLFLFNVTLITVTDKEPSKSKHTSVPAEGSLLLFRQTSSTPQPPSRPAPPLPASGFAVHCGTTNKQDQAGEEESGAQPPQQGRVFLKAS